MLFVVRIHASNGNKKVTVSPRSLNIRRVKTRAGFENTLVFVFTMGRRFGSERRRRVFATTITTTVNLVMVNRTARAPPVYAVRVRDYRDNRWAVTHNAYVHGRIRARARTERPWHGKNSAAVREGNEKKNGNKNIKWY